MQPSFGYRTSGSRSSLLGWPSSASQEPTTDPYTLQATFKAPRLSSSCATLWNREKDTAWARCEGPSGCNSRVGWMSMQDPRGLQQTAGSGKGDWTQAEGLAVVPELQETLAALWVPILEKPRDS